MFTIPASFNNLCTGKLEGLPSLKPEASLPRNLPPDGSSFRQVQLKSKIAVLVPPFGYLNLQFFQEVRKKSDSRLLVEKYLA